MAAWEQLVNKLRNPGPSVKVALVGKYVQLNDAYLSVVEALQHACIAQDASLDLHWVCAEQIEADGADALLRGMDAVVVPGGFGNRGVDGKIAAIRWAREQRVPFLGLCLGMQTAVIEWARNQAGRTEATSADMDQPRMPFKKFLTLSMFDSPTSNGLSPSAVHSTIEPS